MTVAIVTGLIPTTYKCHSLWFGFLCVRLVILFLAELPITKLEADSTCKGIGDRICFHRHFHKPMMVAQNFILVLVVFSVLPMELFSSHLRSVTKKRSTRGRTDVELEA